MSTEALVLALIAFLIGALGPSILDGLFGLLDWIADLRQERRGRNLRK